MQNPTRLACLYDNVINTSLLAAADNVTATFCNEPAAPRSTDLIFHVEEGRR